MPVTIQRPLLPGALMKQSPFDLIESDLDSHASKEHCVICMEPIKIGVLLPCNHNMLCYKCVLIEKALYKNFFCPLCKMVPENVIITTNCNKEYGSFDFSDLYYDTNCECYLDPAYPPLIEGIKKLFAFECPFASCEDHFKGINDLKFHLSREHTLGYCDTCLKDRKVFLFQQKLFTREELTKHRSEWDGGIEDLNRDAHLSFKKDVNLILGHPICEFCGIEFYGQEQLLKHMAQVHCGCMLCHQIDSGEWEYFKDQQSLQKHFKQKHFPCQFPECVQKGYIVFRTKQELDAHIYAEHNTSLSNSQRSEFASNFVGFQYETSSRVRRGRGVDLASSSTSRNTTDDILHIYQSERSPSVEEARTPSAGIQESSISPPLSLTPEDFPSLPISQTISKAPKKKEQKEAFPALEGLKEVKPKRSTKGKSLAARLYGSDHLQPSQTNNVNKKKEKEKEKEVEKKKEIEELFKQQEEFLKKQREEEAKIYEKQQKIMKEKKEKERKEKQEQERLAREKKEKERKEKEEIERKKKEEQERLEKERLEKEKQEKEQRAEVGKEIDSQIENVHSSSKEAITHLQAILNNQEHYNTIVTKAREFVKSEITAKEYSDCYFSFFTESNLQDAKNVFIELLSILGNKKKKNELRNIISNMELSERKKIEEQKRKLEEEEERKRKEEEEKKRKEEEAQKRKVEEAKRKEEERQRQEKIRREFNFEAEMNKQKAESDKMKALEKEKRAQGLDKPVRKGWNIQNPSQAVQKDDEEFPSLPISIPQKKATPKKKVEAAPQPQKKTWNTVAKKDSIEEEEFLDLPVTPKSNESTFEEEFPALPSEPQRKKYVPPKKQTNPIDEELPSWVQFKKSHKRK